MAFALFRFLLYLLFSLAGYHHPEGFVGWKSWKFLFLKLLSLVIIKKKIYGTEVNSLSLNFNPATYQGKPFNLSEPVNELRTLKAPISKKLYKSKMRNYR